MIRILRTPRPAPADLPYYVFPDHATAARWVESLPRTSYRWQWALTGATGDPVERDLLGCLTVRYWCGEFGIIGEILAGPSFDGRIGIWQD